MGTCEGRDGLMCLISLCALKMAARGCILPRELRYCYIRPVLECASQVWHSSIGGHLSNKIEHVQKRACRIIIGYQYYDSYSNALEVLGIPSLESRRDALLYNFGTKLMHSHRFRHMLPPLKSDCVVRNLRDSSIAGLVIPKHRTERYGRSTIPALAKLL